MNIETFTNTIEKGTVPEIKNTRQNRHTHILLLREVTAPARFTTDGETVNTARVQMGDPQGESVPIRAVELFYRKQPGAERRIAKSIQRDLLSEHDTCANDYMDPNEMQQNSPESVLFGSAAGNESVAQRSRVYYNTAYSLRDASMIVRQNTQTAAGDTTRSRSEEGQGTWTPDFVQPGTLLPSVVTLDSAIPEEVLFVLAVLARTTRYGANETRGGNVSNHILGVYAGHGDGPANLEVARHAVSELASLQDSESVEEIVNAQALAVGDAKSATKDAYEKLCEMRGLSFDQVAEEDVAEVVQTLQDDSELRHVMERQLEQVEDYIKRFKES